MKQEAAIRISVQREFVKQMTPLLFRLTPALLFAAAVLTISAQSSTRDVHGVVTEQGGEPLRGAVVELKDTQTLAIRSFITTRDGAYHFSDLNADAFYELRASYRGKWSSSHELTRFNEKRHPVINIKIRID